MYKIGEFRHEFVRAHQRGRCQTVDTQHVIVEKCQIDRQLFEQGGGAYRLHQNDFNDIGQSRRAVTVELLLQSQLAQRGQSAFETVQQIDSGAAAHHPRQLLRQQRVETFSATSG